MIYAGAFFEAVHCHCCHYQTPFSLPYFWKRAQWATYSLCFWRCQMKNNIFNSCCFFPTGWLKLQHSRWYRSILWSHQSVRELRKHDNHLFHQSLLLWKASSRKSRGGYWDGLPWVSGSFWFLLMLFVPSCNPSWTSILLPRNVRSAVNHCVSGDTAVYKILDTCCLESISVLPVAAFSLQLTSTQPSLSHHKSVEGKMLFAPISKYSSNQVACLNSIAMTKYGGLYFFTTYSYLTHRTA